MVSEEAAVAMETEPAMAANATGYEEGFMCDVELLFFFSLESTWKRKRQCDCLCNYFHWQKRETKCPSTIGYI